MLPTNRDECLTALLRPFKAYTWFGLVLLVCMFGVRITGLRAFAEATVPIHLISFAVLVLGGMAQLAFRAQKAALTTLAYALAIAVVSLLLPNFVATQARLTARAWNGDDAPPGLPKPDSPVRMPACAPRFSTDQPAAARPTAV